MMLSWQEWNAHCDQWHADMNAAAQFNAQRSQMLANICSHPDYLRAMAAATAERYKLAHWRHRADEVCGRIYEDLT